MPQARPLVQAALEEHLGPIADRVLKSGRVRFSGPGYRLELMTRIVTLGPFPNLEFTAIATHDHASRRLAEILGKKKLDLFESQTVRIQHHRIYELWAEPYGPLLDKDNPFGCAIMGDDYPDLHVHHFRQMLENDLLPWLETLSDPTTYDAFVTEDIRFGWPYLNLDRQAIHAICIRTLTDPSRLDPLIARCDEALAQFEPFAKEPYTHFLDALATWRQAAGV